MHTVSMRHEYNAIESFEHYARRYSGDWKCGDIQPSNISENIIYNINRVTIVSNFNRIILASSHWPHMSCRRCERNWVVRCVGVVVMTFDLRLSVAGLIPSLDISGYFWYRWPHFASKLSGGITTTRSTQHCIPPGSLNRVPASAEVKVGRSPLQSGRYNTVWSHLAFGFL